MFGSHMSLKAVSSGKSLPSLLGVFAVLNRTPDRCAIPDGLWMLLSAMAVKVFPVREPDAFTWWVVAFERLRV
jgi:hypothetical protein